MLQLNLEKKNRLPQSKYPDKKIRECAGAGFEPTTFCVQTNIPVTHGCWQFWHSKCTVQCYESPVNSPGNQFSGNFPVGQQTTVTCTATDACQLSTRCTFMFLVVSYNVIIARNDNAFVIDYKRNSLVVIRNLEEIFSPLPYTNASLGYWPTTGKELILWNVVLQTASKSSMDGKTRKPMR